MELLAIAGLGWWQVATLIILAVVEADVGTGS